MTKRSTATPAGSRVRCASYTRKSAEEGLEQSYNSLDAQRDACEAYVMSQAGEGWSAIQTHYDDGGFSGGTMERPGLKRLLSDIAAKRVDVVVVYKVDRLTRSLTDFARIVEIFDASSVSFVSVTQAFNTTSSMGRLTLNVLLSFAQFEREVTGERIRDKIAASKRRGMWMGGIPPLGYRAENRLLLVDEAEASTVRHIYNRYLALGSVRLVREELEGQGIRSPGRRTGKPEPFARGALYHLLSNRLYLGEIVHKGTSHTGLHEAIVDRQLFDAVGAIIASKKRARWTLPDGAARAPLTGLIFDEGGLPMSPVFTRNRHGRIYRYYVSAGFQTGTLASGQGGTRVTAPMIEALVVDRVQKVIPSTDEATLLQHVTRVEIGEGDIILTLKPSGRVQFGQIQAPETVRRTEEGAIVITVPGQIRRWRGRSVIARPDLKPMSGVRIDRTMIRGLARAHQFLNDVKAVPARPIAELAAIRKTREPYFRRLAQLAFLAPDIQQAILDGRQPASLCLERLMKKPIPLEWSAQRHELGFIVR